MEKVNGSPLLTWIRNRIKKNKNCIIIINGATGSGKTYGALELCCEVAEMFKTNFTVKDNMDFNFAGLLEKTMLKKNDKPGTPFLFEEVGAVGGGAASREWQGQANRFFFSFMQTTRHRNQVLIMTCPHFSFLERGARSLVHMQIETDGIDFDKKVAYFRCYRVQVNSRTGNFYFKYLRVNQNGNRYRFKRMGLSMPPKDITYEYELLKTKYTGNLNKIILDKAKDKKKVQKKRENGAVDLLALEKLLESGLTNKQIAKAFFCTDRTVRNYKNKLKTAQNLPNIAPVPGFEGLERKRAPI